MTEVMRRAVDGMAAEGRPYRGVLYAGLMIDGGKVKTLEFNARFGDPECQPLLMRLKSDIIPVLLGVANGDTSGIELEWHDQAAVCVVMASGGYPGDYRKGDVIQGLDVASAISELVVFHAGTGKRGDAFVTNGGRVLGVTGRGPTVAAAIAKAYEGVVSISWDGMHYRQDIGKKALGR
jgi:phosphoribosylamine--glycine ligase